MPEIYMVTSTILGLLVLLGIRWMSSPETAVRGNWLSAFSLTVAVVLVLWSNQILTLPILWVGMAVGGFIGYLLAIRVTMNRMPQLVALFNGLGGGASALVALVEVFERFGEMPMFNAAAGQLALVVGGLSLSGSVIAALKLEGRMTQRPVVLPAHGTLSTLSMVAMLVLIGVSTTAVGLSTILSLVILLLALGYGVLLSIRVGGADMPITISLLNSFSGLAGAILGFTIAEPLLVIIGAIVGASGLVLTQLMCRAMNRSLGNVLSGAIVQRAAGDDTPEEEPEEAEEQEDEEKPSVVEILKNSKKVVIAPGYGMAVAQAQQQVKLLAEILEGFGADVDFAIHPVAGRMPGHMNVLLAEVDIPYDKLRDMDDINPELEEADAVIVVGACDVVNPAANDADDSPISGMPILQIQNAENVIVCNLDTEPGYSGVENPLYQMSHVHLVLGDAKESLTELIRELQQ